MPGTSGTAAIFGTLYVVATPIGNLEDVSARAVRVLREVALIAAEDTRRTGHLLARYDIRTPTTSLNQHNEARKADALVSRLVGGESVAVVSDAGTPTVSDPGQHLIRRAIAAGVRVEAVPGPSAVLALLAVAGLPTARFTFLGYPPIRSSERNEWFRTLETQTGTVVFFEAPHRIVGTLERIRHYYGNCHIVVGRELTKLHEQVLRGSLDEVRTALDKPQGEFCLAINFGERHNSSLTVHPSDDQIRSAYLASQGQGASSKRRAVQATARTLGLSTNDVYQALERHKQSAK